MLDRIGCPALLPAGGRDRGIHPGTAFTEPRFYPPGWVKQFHRRSCAARDWCAALTIGSLSEDPVNGITLNPPCQGEIRGGIECVSFAPGP